MPDTPRGTYYRVGADPAWPSAVPGDFFFNADSMVSMFRSGNGYVDFRCRYVRAPVPCRTGSAAVAVRRLP
jgi:carotenoid cleavage dioxygenase